MINEAEKKRRVVQLGLGLCGHSRLKAFLDKPERFGVGQGVSVRCRMDCTPGPRKASLVLYASYC
jgi:hypothetical protein